MCTYTECIWTSALNSSLLNGYHVYAIAIKMNYWLHAVETMVALHTDFYCSETSDTFFVVDIYTTSLGSGAELYCVFLVMSIIFHEVA